MTIGVEGFEPRVTHFIRDHLQVEGRTAAEIVLCDAVPVGKAEVWPDVLDEGYKLCLGRGAEGEGEDCITLLADVDGGDSDQFTTRIGSSVHEGVKVGVGADDPTTGKI